MFTSFRPTICKICGGPVIYEKSNMTSSGFRYRCQKCGACIGTHKPRPKDAMGELGDGETRALRAKCHELFDERWRKKAIGPISEKAARTTEYVHLARYLGINEQECHFGYMDKEMLQKALEYLESEA